MRVVRVGDRVGVGVLLKRGSMWVSEGGFRGLAVRFAIDFTELPCGVQDAIQVRAGEGTWARPLWKGWRHCAQTKHLAWKFCPNAFGFGFGFE